MHGNAKDSEERQWTEHVLNSISEIARSEGNIFLLCKTQMFH